MPVGSWVPQRLVQSRDVGSFLTTYTGAKSVINAVDLLPIPGGMLRKGSLLRLRAKGGLSNIVTTPGTTTFQVMMGSVVAWTSGAIQLNATAHTKLPFILEVDLRVDADGSGTAATFMGEGWLNGIMFTNTAAQTDAVNTTGQFPVPATAPADGTGWDSTVANVLDFWQAFSISNAGNGVQIDDYSVDWLWQ